VNGSQLNVRLFGVRVLCAICAGTPHEDVFPKPNQMGAVPPACLAARILQVDGTWL